MDRDLYDLYKKRKKDPTFRIRCRNCGFEMAYITAQRRDNMAAKAAGLMEGSIETIKGIFLFLDDYPLQ